MRCDVFQTFKPVGPIQRFELANYIHCIGGKSCLKLFCSNCVEHMHWCPLLQVSVRQIEALTLALSYACHAAVRRNQQCDIGPEIVVGEKLIHFGSSFGQFRPAAGHVKAKLHRYMSAVVGPACRPLADTETEAPA